MVDEYGTRRGLELMTNQSARGLIIQASKSEENTPLTYHKVF